MGYGFDSKKVWIYIYEAADVIRMWQCVGVALFLNALSTSWDGILKGLLVTRELYAISSTYSSLAISCWNELF